MFGGLGLIENVVEEILCVLNDYELIKVKVVGEDCEECVVIIVEIVLIIGVEIV